MPDICLAPYAIQRTFPIRSLRSLLEVLWGQRGSLQWVWSLDERGHGGPGSATCIRSQASSPVIPSSSKPGLVSQSLTYTPVDWKNRQTKKRKLTKESSACGLIVCFTQILCTHFHTQLYVVCYNSNNLSVGYTLQLGSEGIAIKADIANPQNLPPKLPRTTEDQESNNGTDICIAFSML